MKIESNFKVTKTSNDGVIVFDEESHTYVNTQTGIIPESVTTYVKRHTNPFDADFHAGNYAIKHGMEKQAVLDMWKAKGIKSAIAGTMAHKILETYVSTGRVENVEPCDYIEGIQAIIKGLYISGEYIPVKTEFLLYDDNLSGICDIIVRNKKGEYFIFDYKTNKDISTFGYKKFMKPPYEYLPDANYYHYSLQLSLYKRMCKEYPIKGCFIVHIQPLTYKLIKFQDYFRVIPK